MCAVRVHQIIVVGGFSTMDFDVCYGSICRSERMHLLIYETHVSEYFSCRESGAIEIRALIRQPNVVKRDPTLTRKTKVIEIYSFPSILQTCLDPKTFDSPGLWLFRHKIQLHKNIRYKRNYATRPRKHGY